MEKYDIAIIGGGPGGYNGAVMAGKAGKKVVLFEKNAIGGVCLNEGCIPSKTLLSSAKLLEKINHGENYGIINEKCSIDLPALMKRKQRIIKVLQAGINTQLKNAGVKVVLGEAKFNDKANGLFCIKANDEEYLVDKAIIAVGGKPFIPNIDGVSEQIVDKKVLTSREILNIQELPQRLVIVGGGVIGLEMAQFFATAKCEVSVVEMADHIGGNIDLDVSKTLQKALEDKGIKFYLSCTVTSVKENVATYIMNEKQYQLNYDALLLSVGRVADTNNLNLKCMNVDMNRRAIKVDDKMQTSEKGLYAIGDAVGILPLAHTAYRQGEVAINNILGKDDKMQYLIPSVIYTTPEVAFVGLMEKDVSIDKIKSVSLPMSYSGRYAAENIRKEGFVKIIYDSEEKIILGGAAVGDYAGEYISTITSYIALKTKIDDIKKIVFPHPTNCELIKETLFDI